MYSPGTGRRGRTAAPLAAAVTATALLVAGCGSSSDTASAGTPSGGPGSAAPRSVKVALVLGLTANPFMQEVAQGSQDAAADLGGSVTVTGPAAPNPTVGVSQLQQLVGQGVKGVTIMPLPASLWSKGVSDAAAKTRVNIVNTLAVKGVRGSETYIGINDAAASTAMLDEVFARLGPQPRGEIVLGSCIPGVSALDTRTQTYVKYITSKAPGVKIVGPVTTTTDPSKNLSNWNQAYSAHPGALAYLGNCDNDGPSLARMHEQHPGSYQTATFDIDPSSLTAIRSGALSVAVDESPYARGYLATAALIHAAQGKPAITGFINVKGVLVTKDNVDAITTREASHDSTRAAFTPVLKAFLADPEKAGGPVAREPIANAYDGATE